MWEYCITINSEKREIINYIKEQLQIYVKNYEGILTFNERAKVCDILIACNKYEKNRLIMYIQNIICECICFFYKKEFLMQNLSLSIHDKICKQAFIFALLYFDKETDNYIVNKYLNIENKINIDGFFNFRLQTLKEKWSELIDIANQNEVYLYSDDTFMELIKFLVDNIEVKNDVINIMSTQNSYGIFDSKFNEIENGEINEGEEELIAKLIALCPKNINIYCSEILPNEVKDLICKLFEKRVKFISNNL